MSDLGNFIWYELLTTDAAAAKAYYDSVVGWNIDPEGSEVPGGGRYHMIGRSDAKPAGGMMELTGEMQAGGARPGWLAYIQTPDVDLSVQQLTEKGGTVHMEAMDMPGIGRMAMVADPQGAAFYLMTPEPPEGDPDAASDVFSPDKAQHIRWNELITDDPEAAIALYAELFGWHQDGGMPMGEMGEYQFLHHGDVNFGAVMPRPPEMPVSAWNFYIGVDDIDRAAKAVTGGGGKLLGEIMQIPGGEYSVHTVDPQGATVGYVGPRK